ncbi:hypothetical protein DOK76_06050 [Vagococcus sp. DIV0080]|uniref:Uncharacterized protein n=1 Tax=Candidatus Vagococcus giribetii TaxID=2230876 RepID=A0ABS3HSC5_9ENTE|nr:hypothetical protein [Vagococcus sp. DIV0080]MBO0476625.1 hypothetical protein [Vagococcus sp. DIV0080]
MSLIINITSIVVIFASMLFFYYRSNVAKKSPLGQKVMAFTSQITMSAFILGLGILLIELNAMGLSRSKFVDHLLLYGAFVSLVNSLSLWYFSRTLSED